MTESTGAKPPAAKPPAAKPPATAPATNGVTPPDTIIEIVGDTDKRLVLAALLIGIGLGTLVVYLVTRLVIEDAES